MTLGQIAVSKAGRDKDKVFIIVGIVNEHYVLISDGKLRKIEKPKKKKLKHLKINDKILFEASEKLSKNIKLENKEIRKYLKEY